MLVYQVVLRYISVNVVNFIGLSISFKIILALILRRLLGYQLVLNI